MRTEGGGYRRDHLRVLAQRVEVDTKEVRILGSKSVLLRTLVAASSAKTAGLALPVLYRSGAPEEIRTPDPQIRSLVLYPAELRARVARAGKAPENSGSAAIAIGFGWGWQVAGPCPERSAA